MTGRGPFRSRRCCHRGAGVAPEGAQPLTLVGDARSVDRDSRRKLDGGLSVRALLVILALSLAVLAAWRVLPFGADRPGSVASAAATSISHTVVNSGATAYLVDGVANATLILHRGETYVFNVNASGHPFYIKTARGAGTGNQYSQGVTGQGVSMGQLTLVVPLDAPNTLVRGRQIRELWNGRMPAGEHSVRWDGRDRSGKPAANGIYFYGLDVDGRRLGGRLVMRR